MSGFTKGPWQIDVNNVHAGTVATVHRCTYGWADIWSDKWMEEGMGPEVMDANARLIAAAPELYERLKEARDAIASLPEYALGGENIVHPHDGEVVCHYPIRDELLSNIDAALSKAAGEGR